MSTWRVKYLLQNDDGTAKTGATGLMLSIERESDGYLLDFDDLTFKTSGSVTTAAIAMSEVDSTNLPGLYDYTLTTTDWDGGTYNAYIYHLTDPKRYGIAETKLVAGQQTIPGQPTAGALQVTYTITNAVGGAGIENVHVWVTADAAGVKVISAAQTNSSGIATVYSDDGAAVYVWIQKGGWTPTTTPKSHTFTSASATGSNTMTQITLVAGSQTWSTTRQALSELGMLLGDPAEKQFYKPIKLGLLNAAQNKLLRLVNRQHLNDLDASNTSIAFNGSTGAIVLSSLDNPPFDDAFGIDLIVTDDDNETPFDAITYSQYKRALRENKSWTEDKPVYYQRGGSIYILPYDGTFTAVDIHVMKVPSAYTCAEDPADDGVSLLSESLQKIVIGLACEDYIELTLQAARAYAGAVAAINAINGKLDAGDDNQQQDHFNNFPNIALAGGGNNNFPVILSFS